MKGRYKFCVFGSTIENIDIILWLKEFTCFSQFLRLTLSWRRPLSCRNQSIDLPRFLYDNSLRHERIKRVGLFLWSFNFLFSLPILTFWNLSHIPCNYETLHNYTLPKEDPKNILITWHTPWVLLTSAFFHRKSANFAISRNTDIDCILIRNF